MTTAAGGDSTDIADNDPVLDGHRHHSQVGKEVKVSNNATIQKYDLVDIRRSCTFPAYFFIASFPVFFPNFSLQSPLGMRQDFKRFFT